MIPIVKIDSEILKDPGKQNNPRLFILFGINTGKEYLLVNRLRVHSKEYLLKALETFPFLRSFYSIGVVGVVSFHDGIGVVSNENVPDWVWSLWKKHVIGGSGGDGEDLIYGSKWIFRISRISNKVNCHIAQVIPVSNQNNNKQQDKSKWSEWRIPEKIIIEKDLRKRLTYHSQRCSIDCQFLLNQDIPFKKQFQEIERIIHENLKRTFFLIQKDQVSIDIYLSQVLQSGYIHSLSKDPDYLLSLKTELTLFLVVVKPIHENNKKSKNSATFSNNNVSLTSLFDHEFIQDILREQLVDHFRWKMRHCLKHVDNQLGFNDNQDFSPKFKDSNFSYHLPFWSVSKVFRICSDEEKQDIASSSSSFLDIQLFCLDSQEVPKLFEGIEYCLTSEESQPQLSLDRKLGFTRMATKNTLITETTNESKKKPISRSYSLLESVYKVSWYWILGMIILMTSFLLLSHLT